MNDFKIAFAFCVGVDFSSTVICVFRDDIDRVVDCATGCGAVVEGGVRVNADRVSGRCFVEEVDEMEGESRGGLFEEMLEVEDDLDDTEL